MHIAAGEFKAQCLSLMDEVRRKHHTYIITKRGKPVAKLVPVDDASELPVYGFLKGKATITGDIVSPTGEHWDADV